MNVFGYEVTLARIAWNVGWAIFGWNIGQFAAYYRRRRIKRARRHLAWVLGAVTLSVCAFPFLP